MVKYWREFMIQSVNLTNDIFWLGILDPHLDGDALFSEGHAQGGH